MELRVASSRIVRRPTRGDAATWPSGRGDVARNSTTLSLSLSNISTPPASILAREAAAAALARALATALR
eukprot:7388781-Prymnesium_polylepis.1